MLWSAGFGHGYNQWNYQWIAMYIYIYYWRNYIHMFTDIAFPMLVEILVILFPEMWQFKRYFSINIHQFVIISILSIDQYLGIRHSRTLWNWLILLSFLLLLFLLFVIEVWQVEVRIIAVDWSKNVFENVTCKNILFVSSDGETYKKTIVTWESSTYT